MWRCHGGKKEKKGGENANLVKLTYFCGFISHICCVICYIQW